MPRNERLVQPSETIQIYDVSTGNVVSSSTTVNTVLATGRDDAESTFPVMDVYVKPTDYFGRFYIGSSQPFDTLYYSKFYAKYRGRRGVAVLSTAIGTSPPFTWKATAYGLPVLSSKMASCIDSSLRKQITNQNWNLGQTLGELPETLAAIRDLTNTIVTFLKLLHGGNEKRIWDYVKRIRKYGPRKVTRGDYSRSKGFRGLKHFTSDKRVRSPSRRWTADQVMEGAAHGWLAYKFFWQPLMSDIHSLCETIESGVIRDGAFRVSSSATEALPPPGLITSNHTWIEARFKGKVSAKAELAFKVTNPTLFTLDTYGILDPLSVAWELVPLSFVVDWFLPIGNFLSSLSRPMGLSFSWGYRTSYMEWSGKWSWYLNLTLYERVGGSIPTATGVHKSSKRELYITFPVPAPYFRGFGNNPVSKALTLLALIVK